MQLDIFRDGLATRPLNQKERIVKTILLSEPHGVKTAALIKDLYVTQYNARILEARKEGHVITATKLHDTAQWLFTYGGFNGEKKTLHPEILSLVSEWQKTCKHNLTPNN